jgi:hypothetical protein
MSAGEGFHVAEAGSGGYPLPPGLARRRTVTGSPDHSFGEREDTALQAPAHAAQPPGERTVVGYGVRVGPAARGTHPTPRHGEESFDESP